MKNLVIAALLSLAPLTLAPGCIIVDDDDDGDGPPIDEPTGGIDVQWNLVSFADAGDGCAAAGVTTIEVVSDPTPGAEGDELRDVFNCDDLGGVTAPTAAGTYDVYLNAWSEDVGSLLVAQSGFQTVDIAGPNDLQSLPVFDVYWDAAFFSLSWTLVDSANAEVSCADAGAATVSVDGTLQPSGDLVPAGEFDCEVDGEGITNPVPLGDYSVSVAALDTDKAAVGVAGAVDDQLALGNETSFLGDIVIPIDAL